MSLCQDPDRVDQALGARVDNEVIITPPRDARQACTALRSDGQALQLVVQFVALKLLWIHVEVC